MDRATPKLTRFFRNSDQLKALEHIVLPGLLARRRAEGESALQVWSAGCSTGEEAFTLAILLRELLPQGFAFTITATDRSPGALATARRGSYAEASVRSVPPRFRHSYFTRVEGEYRVVDAIRESVRFRLEEIGSAGARDEYDIVACRNVITYLPEAERPAFAGRLWRTMRSGAYLLLGGSESLFGAESRFEYLANEWCSLYRKG